jgi:zinc transport system substrate-binding protein
MVTIQMTLQRLYQSFSAFLGFVISSSLVLFSLQSVAQESNEDKIKVVTFIPPLAYMASDLAGDYAEVSMLSQNGSPHHRVLKPSDVSSMQDAHMILWVGQELEKYLTRFASRYEGKMFSLIELTPESTHIHSEEGHDHGHEGHGHGDEHGAGIDPHLWLSPAAISAFGLHVHEQLVTLMPNKKRQLKERYQQWQSKLNASQEKWTQQLLPYKNKPYFVYHEAYKYLEQLIGLESKAVLTVNPGVKPSAKKLGQLSRMLRGTEAACVLFEPEFQQIRLDRVTKAKLVYQQVDPLGSFFTPNKSGDSQYIQFIDHLIGEFDQCLSQIP